LQRSKHISSIRSLDRIERRVVQPWVEAGDVVPLQRGVVADILRGECVAVDDETLINRDKGQREVIMMPEGNANAPRCSCELPRLARRSPFLAREAVPVGPE
jgi:hypothetical protein